MWRYHFWLLSFKTKQEGLQPPSTNPRQALTIGKLVGPHLRRSLVEGNMFLNHQGIGYLWSICDSSCFSKSDRSVEGTQTCMFSLHVHHRRSVGDSLSRSYSRVDILNFVCVKRGYPNGQYQVDQHCSQKYRWGFGETTGCSWRLITCYLQYQQCCKSTWIFSYDLGRLNPICKVSNNSKPYIWHVGSTKFRPTVPKSLSFDLHLGIGDLLRAMDCFANGLIRTNGSTTSLSMLRFFDNKLFIWEL